MKITDYTNLIFQNYRPLLEFSDIDILQAYFPNGSKPPEGHVIRMADDKENSVGISRAVLFLATISRCC